jgi:hypothetical protein
MSVRFRWGLYDIRVQNPDLNNVVEQRRMQVIRQSAAGSYYVYDKGVKTEIWTLRWSNLRDSEKYNLESFFGGQVECGLYQFVFTDWRNDEWNVRLLQPSVVFTEVADVRASSGSFQSGSGTYPTTIREDGVWATEIRILKLSAF